MQEPDSDLSPDSVDMMSAAILSQLRGTQPLSADEVRQIATQVAQETLRSLSISGPGVSGGGFNWVIDPPKDDSQSESISDDEEIVEDIEEEQYQPFQLVPISSSSMRVTVSTLAGDLPSGFNASDDPIKTISIGASGIIYGKITINSDTGEVETREVLSGASLPDDTDTVFHVSIGGYGGFEPVNYRFGPIDATICRDHFSDPTTWGVTFS